MFAFAGNIGIISGYIPKKIMAKIIFLLFLFYALIICALFQSATVNSMTGFYYQEQISSLKEAIENDFDFAGTDYTYPVLKSREDELSLKMIKNFRICEKILPCLLKLYNNSKLVTIIQESFVKFEPTIDRTKIYCSKETLFSYYNSFRARGGFYLMPEIDKIILRLIESGIAMNWRLLQIHENEWLNTNSSEFTALKINDKRTFDEIQTNRDEIIPLNAEHIGGAIFIFVVGNLIAFIVFVCEILIKKCVTRKSNKILLMLVSIFDLILE